MKFTEVTKKQYREKICEIAKAFDYFCRSHNLRYFGIGGTAIGAIRHKGIIPWDDDIDFVMPRPDYDSFIALSGELAPKYEVFTHKNNPLYHLTMAKMCDANTSYLASFEQHLMLGAFIDIFPLDGCPGETKEERTQFFNDYMVIRHNGEALRNYYSFRSLLSAVHMKRFDDIPRQLRSHWFHLIGKTENPFFDKCDAILASIPYDTSDYVAYFSTWRSAKIISPREWFSDYYYAPFEDFQIRLPVGIHEYLTQLFGDYMVPPPKEIIDIDNHGFAFIDMDRRISWEQAYKKTKITGR